MNAEEWLKQLKKEIDEAEEIPVDSSEEGNFYGEETIKEAFNVGYAACKEELWHHDCDMAQKGYDKCKAEVLRAIKETHSGSFWEVGCTTETCDCAKEILKRLNWLEDYEAGK